MSTKITNSKSRFELKFKALKARSSKIVCEERLACKGQKPCAYYNCIECGSYQCEECEALLHQDFRLILHHRESIPKPPVDELCEGDCEDKNFADITCVSCNKNFCYICDYLFHSKGKQSHSRRKFVSQSEEFISCEDIPEEYLPYLESTFQESETDEMLSLKSMNSDIPDLFPEHEINSKYVTYKRKQTKIKSFILLNDREALQIKDADEFIEQLGCDNDKQLKVVSIFGNTGDGKSYTLNHTFFDGQEIFKTSSAQVSCTIGAWAAYCPSLGIITVDTEGFLGQATNPNQRSRMLLKVLAISDIVIYRTRAERLHNDMFSFLGDASSAYSKHFAQELQEACARFNLDGPVSILGPGVIIFHETQYTDVLSKNEIQEPEIFLRTRFQELGLKIDAFSSLEYIGICSNSQPTNFSLLQKKIEKHTQNSSVRMARTPAVIYKVLKVLNEKFCGKIERAIPNTFPDQYFTCPLYCKSCNSRCANSMNHEKDNIPHSSLENCIFQHQYENRIFLCKVCFERGEKIVVSPQTMESSESSWVGFAKYAWSGYILECSKCGVIYRSRQYWYGNQNPWETCVRTEICHVWPQSDESQEPTNTAQYVIDNITTVSEVVSSIGAKPMKAISSWMADQIAPSYWVPNSCVTHCSGKCKKEFEDLDQKHHCRMCGGIFCEDCASKTRILPTWGKSPVRVCDDCYENEISFSDDLSSAQNKHNPQEVTVRKIGETVQSTLGTVASVVSYPIGFIKDSARPSDWVPDHLLINCNVCKMPFGPKLSKHHCRSCGEGVCNNCSLTRKPIPSKGWNYDVRVCDSCLVEKSDDKL